MFDSRRWPQPVNMITGTYGCSRFYLGGYSATVDMRHAEVGDDNIEGLAASARGAKCVDATLSPTGNDDGVAILSRESRAATLE